MNRPPRTPPPSKEKALHFGRKNALLALAGLTALVVGYALLARGSITLAPLLLVLGYIVLLPLAILR